MHHGDTTHFLPDNNVYAYFRHTRTESVFVFINLSKETVKVDWKKYRECLTKYTQGINILTGKKIKVGSSLKVEPLTSMIVELSK
ncbi:MAG: cyclomaltodextrinase C-terminal domain-containing protein [Candidatus Azobacteroides sp.]|nr:cyclomaltodextrinase C-terminal domain-containing protein [Candidatus Azobacteroides sp.]